MAEAEIHAGHDHTADAFGRPVGVAVGVIGIIPAAAALLPVHGRTGGCDRSRGRSRGFHRLTARGPPIAAALPHAPLSSETPAPPCGSTRRARPPRGTAPRTTPASWSEADTERG